MERFAPSKWDDRAWGFGIAMACALLAACGDPACPAGSTSINGRCEPAPSCRAGEVLDGGACVDESSIRGDGGELQDASNPSNASDAGDDASRADGSTVDQDAEVTESDDPLCESVDCGDHGSCQVVGDAARCMCKDGFDGARCDVCEDGLVLDDDACVEPCKASDAPDCGDNGACEVNDDVAACVCEHPFAGEACDACAEGFALRANGTCEPDCGECGAHAFCNEELMTPSCECVAGYADDGSGCEWVGDGVTGGIVDGDLEDPDAWTLSNMTVQNGVAEFANVIVGPSCRLGSIEQVIRMPAQEDAEPLVLEIEARTTCASTDGEVCPALLVDIEDTVTRLEVPGGATPAVGELAVCLGQAAFQDETLVRVRPSMATGVGIATCAGTWPSLQRIGIRKAMPGECPGAGQLLGSLNNNAGWILRGNASISGNKLTVGTAAEASTLVSVPAAGGVALQVSTPAPSATMVRLDGLPFQMGTVASPTRICFPEWTFGSVHSLRFENLIGNTEITSLSMVADSTCTGDFDGGFEKPFGTGSWSYFAVTPTRAMSASARSGQYAWQVQSTASSIAGLVLIPGYGDAARRPAMSAWTRVGGASMEGTLDLRVGSLSSYNIISSAQSWGSKRVACLSEEWAGQPALVSAGASARMTTGSGTPIYWIDDIFAESVDSSICN